MTTKDITIRHHNRNISGRLYLPQMDKCPKPTNIPHRKIYRIYCVTMKIYCFL